MKANPAALQAILRAQQKGHDSFKQKQSMDVSASQPSLPSDTSVKEPSHSAGARSNTKQAATVSTTTESQASAPVTAGSLAVERAISTAFKEQGRNVKALDVFREWDQDGAKPRIVSHPSPMQLLSNVF